ncbi:MAG: glycerol 3-phosphate dehydrogenase [Sulfobacillus acidophilus]|uniref:Glycerol 3-phosphate dehydrogenase n=1 Tax=Sulfobacillus acidophilus TaxID=53633 RepID=A0A2T2WJG7_9FIRM|nr:MAG: glycerol 3-phosphate dehydrogenase [Sulfobacillus acidophilus]
MVVVIGGGCTGLGVAWDLILRGVPVTVVEARELGSGTSGRFHGLLHSGGRYAVTDPVSAKQCRQENEVLRRIAPSAVESVGGYFVSVDDGVESYMRDWIAGTQSAGIPVTEVSVETAIRRLPGLNPRVQRAFAVADAVLKGFELLDLLRVNGERRGVTILTETRVTQVQTVNGQVSGISVRTKDGERRIPCDAVVNAAGPWAGQVAQLFGERVQMELSSGLMLIYSNRMVPSVVNRLAPPGDGDIVVPHGRTVILGTTEVPQVDPEPPEPTRESAEYLQSLGQAMFPEMNRWRILRAFVGVRPLFEGNGVVPQSRVSRDFTVVDHGRQGGLQGAFSVMGGKWTTFRLMGERTADVVVEYLHQSSPSISAHTVLEPDAPREKHSASSTICECERVSEAQLLDQMAEPFDNWRTRTWFAMGPCQGTMCAHRAVSLRMQYTDVEGGLDELTNLRRERERGVRPVAWGTNARELALTEALSCQTLAEGVAHDHLR